MMRRNLDVSKTLFALSTGPLPSAVAVERLSGPEAFRIASSIFRAHSKKPLTRERGMFLGNLVDSRGDSIDEVLLLAFVGPHSFTGDDVIEFHCHGSIPILQKLEAMLLEHGAHPAGRGEFSYRAHLNGKLTAAQLERLGDVFLARDLSDLRRIYSRREDSLVDSIQQLREHLIRLRAILDTAVDFVEEYSGVLVLAREPLGLAIQGCSAIIQRYSLFRHGGNVRRLVLAGRPNAGKSSLFNGLLCRYRAIVDPLPGTTRDVVEEDVEVNGRVWKLVDTAGIRRAEAEAERLGMELGEEFLESSHYWLLVVDGTEGIHSEEQDLIRKFSHKPHAILWNKRDLPNWQEPPAALAGERILSVSAKQGDCFPRIWDELRQSLDEGLGDELAPLPTAVQVARLEKVLEELRLLMTEMESERPPEFLSEGVRSAVEKLESVIGEVGTEDVLDRVFGDFCIGK